MKTNDKTTNAKARPLLAVASALSVASLGWTTYSLLDLLKVGAIGLTVAVTADLIWSAVIWCEYKAVGHPLFVKVLGWLAVVVVGGFIAWHGITENNPAMAVAGPFLTLGTKGVWELALMSMKDPTAPSRKDQAALDNELRAINVAAEKSRVATRKEISEEEAKVEKQIAKIRANARLKKEELLAQREIAEAKRQLDEELAESGYELVRMDRVIQGETVPQAALPAAQQAAIPAPTPAPAPVVPPATPVSVPVPPPAVPLNKDPLPASGAKTPQVTVQISDSGLTEAQRNLKRLAASWYMAEVAAKTQGVLLSKAEFARQMGVEKQQVSRATSRFPLEQMTDADYEDAKQSARQSA